MIEFSKRVFNRAIFNRAVWRKCTDFTETASMEISMKYHRFFMILFKKKSIDFRTFFYKKKVLKFLVNEIQVEDIFNWVLEHIKTTKICLLTKFYEY